MRSFLPVWGCFTTRSLSWGVAEITEAGIGGIEAGVVGRLANNDASIWFFSQSLDLPEAADVGTEGAGGGGTESRRDEADDRLAPGWSSFSSNDGRFLPPLLSSTPSLLNPRLLRSPSSPPC